MIKMDFIGAHQVNVSVYTGTAVPAGVGHKIVFHTYSRNILPFPDKLRHIHIKGGIAVAVAASLFSVDIDRGIHIDAFKIQIKLFPFGNIFQSKMFPVPANA